MLRAFQWDLARQVERLDHLLALLPRYADWGYQRLYLHLEDAVDYPSLPGVARTDAYAWRDLEKLVAAAATRGIRTVPIANLLGHTQYLIKHPDWRDLNELRDPATGTPLATGQICPLHPRTPELVERLFTDLAPLCTAGEIHAGLDESFHLGKHPLSRTEVAEFGLAAHFARHVTRLHAAASRHGLRLGLWADMLALLPEAIPLLPAHAGLAAYDWYYHPFGRHPRLELRNFAEYDLAPALRAAGIDYWACPMNGAFRHESAPVWTDRLQNLAAWWRRARDTRAAGYLVTSWEPYRLALPITTLVDAATATLWLDPATPDDPAALLAAGLRRHSAPRSPARPPQTEFVTNLVTNLPTTLTRDAALDVTRLVTKYPGAPASESTLSPAAARALARGLLATDPLAFAGNSRWEINKDWSPVASRRESPSPHARAARRLERLAASPALAGRGSPLGFLAATARFQAYLAHREAFVRNAASHVHRLRRLAAKSAAPHKAEAFATLLAAAAAACAGFAARIRAARTDTRAMWCASRPAEAFAASQNAALLAADAARLRALRAFFRSAGRRPRHVFRASPVCGRWTLRFTVHHFAPCHQKLVVEQLQPMPDGAEAWRELHSRVLIEFRAHAARPRTPHLRFEFACAVEDSGAPLRIASRCLGEFAVSHIELTDGIVVRRHRPLRERPVLGVPAPATGWPCIDWLSNTAVLPVVFT